jgi:hypothetical protein
MISSCVHEESHEVVGLLVTLDFFFSGCFGGTEGDPSLLSLSTSSRLKMGSGSGILFPAFNPPHLVSSYTANERLAMFD